jgi:hypothetical protein
MKKIEYAIDYVPRYYPFACDIFKNPMRETLNKRGDDGWQLCAVGSPDSSGTVIWYFSREKTE